MIKAFFWSKKWALWAYGGGIILLVLSYILVQLSVQFNMWYGGFYNIIQKTQEHTLDEYWGSLIQFMWIAIPYIFVATAMDIIAFFYAFKCREAITFNYVPRWRNVPVKIEGESQRIQEDPQLYAEIVESLGLQAMNAAMTLIAFIPLLWHLSKDVHVPMVGTLTGQIMWFGVIIIIFGGQFWKFIRKEFCSQELPDLQTANKVAATLAAVGFLAILWQVSKIINIESTNGSLVWTALFISLGGMAVTWTVAKRLPKLEYNNQVVEAAWRKELVLAEEDKANFASISTAIELFTGVKRNYYRLYRNKGYVSLWLNTYGQCMVIVPFIIVGPSLMAGIATLGLTMQIVNSFGEVRSSLAVVINNWTRITRLRSIWMRLHEFEVNLDKYQVPVNNVNNNEEEDEKNG